MTNTKGTTMPQIDDAELFGNAEDQRAYEDFCANQEAIEKFTLDKPALICRWRMSNKKVPMLNRHIRALSERLVQGEPLTHNMLSWAKQHVEWSLAEGDYTARDGVLMLLSVSNRKYAAFVYGDKAELLFPDSALQQLEDGFLDDFRNGDWYGGFCDYIDGCADLLSGESYTGSDSDYAYSPGHDADVDPGFSAPSLLRNLGIALVISCVIALIVCLILKAKMRSVRRQTEARAYVTPAGLHLTRRDDVYTHTTTTRRKIERDNDHHSGGGGSSFSGGGGHGRSGSF